MGWEVGGSSPREGTYVYLQLIHVGLWQKPAQYCKAIILQLKINDIFFLKEDIWVASADGRCVRDSQCNYWINVSLQ